jgi:hypothetical protein
MSTSKQSPNIKAVTKLIRFNTAMSTIIIILFRNAYQ